MTRRLTPCERTGVACLTRRGAPVLLVSIACSGRTGSRDTMRVPGHAADDSTRHRAAATEAPTMNIDIDTLTEPELIDLNHRIVARLRVLRDMRAHVGMLEFRIGDRVTFQPPGRHPLQGVLTRYNRKTVTVITDDGAQWKYRRYSSAKLRNPRPTTLPERMWSMPRQAPERRNGDSSCSRPR